MKKCLLVPFLAITFLLTNYAVAQTPPMKDFKTKDGSTVQLSANLKAKAVVVAIDSTTSPKFVCLSIDISGITGSQFAEMIGATHNYTVYDANNKPLPIKEKVLKKVGGLMEENIINYTIKLPYKLKTEPAGNYAISYSLEAGGGRKKISVFAKAK